MFKQLGSIISRELRLYYRRRSDILTSLLFFILAAITFAFNLSTGDQMMYAMFENIFLGIIWVAALFSVILSIHKIYEDDYADGSMQQFLLSKTDLETIVLGKIIANWVAYFLPLVFCCPIIIYYFGLDMSKAMYLVTLLLVATPILVLIGSIVSTLLMGNSNAKTLLAILIIPLYLPVMIYGISSSQEVFSNDSENFTGNIMVLGGLMIIAIPVSIWFSSFVIRNTK